MIKDLAVFRRLPHPLGLLIATQFAFNAGFYLVVPFLASYLEDDLGLAVALIGVILGLRTFSQQGLFFLGGALSDWVGVKPVLLTGIGVRVVGFATLAATRELPWIIAGVTLIGVAAALFSPATESAILGLAGETAKVGGPPRTAVLSLQQVFAQAGSAVGPALGGVVLFVSFQVTCVIAALLFAVIGVIHAVWLPSRMRVGERTHIAQSFRLVLRNRRFLVFAALNTVQLLAYNQMYLALPVEIHRSLDDSSTITWYFLLASILVISTQSVITRMMDRLPTATVFQVGHLCTAAGFLIIAAVAWFPSPRGLLGILPKAGLVILLHAGFMAVQPRARDTVGHLAGENQLGAHMGIMSSMGGLVVLLAGGPIGGLLEWARTPGGGAVVPWGVLAGIALLVAALSAPVIRWVEQGD